MSDEMSDNITITINGEARAFRKGSALPTIIEVLGISPATLLVEHNGTALHRSEWEKCLVAEGDRLELLHIAAGG